MARTLGDELSDIDWGKYVRDQARAGIYLNLRQIVDEIGFEQMIRQVGRDRLVAKLFGNPDQLFDALSLEQREQLKRRLQ